MAIPVLDTEKCNGCRTCAEVCPAGCFTFPEREIVEDYSKCLGCGRCIRTCPVKAISFETL